MKNLTIGISLFLLIISQGLRAQIKDISFTLSPVGEYTWFDDKSGLSDAFLIGGKLGFGFGEYVELRGIYFRSLDLNTSFDNFGLPNYSQGMLAKRNLTLTRWGGEFKANIGTGSLNPYLTLGTGVQTIDLDEGEDFDQIYASAGLGIKFNAGDRTTFSLEGKNTTYNFNAGENFLTDTERALFGLSGADFSRERLSNWSVQGAVQFYLGGREPGTLSELDQAYLNKFRGGFKGLQFVLEPGGQYVNFDNSSSFRDTWMLGTYGGIDFNEFIGIRAFYFHATQNEEISFDFDPLRMYGMEFRARLNDGSGVTPFIILGGGYLNPYSDYVGRDNLASDGTAFATGGLGLDIPLSPNVAIIGGVRAMLTSGEGIEDITVTDDLQTHLMYNAGLKFTLGKRSASPQAVYQRNLNRELDSQQAVYQRELTRELNAQQALNDQKIQNFKEDYKNEIDSLEQELKMAYEARDVEKAVELLEKKKETEKELDEVIILEEQNKGLKARVVETQDGKVMLAAQQEKLIQMTPVEFELLIERILKSLEETSAPAPVSPVPPAQTMPGLQQPMPYNQYQQQQLDLLNKRIDFLEKLLIEVNMKGVGQSTVPSQPEAQSSQDRVSDMSDKIMDRLDELNRKIDDNAYRLSLREQNGQTVVVSPQGGGESRSNIARVDEQGNVVDIKKMPGANQTLLYKNMSALLGFNYGEASTLNVGMRVHYDLVNSPLEFMPEAYLGFGEGTSFGISANLILPFTTGGNEEVLPYVGFGLGFASIDDNFHGNYNLLIGAQLPILNPNFYFDYTMRNSFKYNQFAIGYKFGY